jgi:hypothetical protein
MRFVEKEEYAKSGLYTLELIISLLIRGNQNRFQEARRGKHSLRLCMFLILKLFADGQADEQEQKPPWLSRRRVFSHQRPARDSHLRSEMRF